MNIIQLFEYLEKDVRVVIRDGVTWFALKDLCDVLELSDTNKVSERIESEDLTRIKIGSGGQDREMLFVNECGMYDVVTRSDKPKAYAFRRWITHEVLPAIKKTGGYGLESERLKLQALNTNIKIATALHKVAKDSSIDETRRAALMERVIELLTQ